MSAIPITPFRSDAELRRYVEEARALSGPPPAAPMFSPPPLECPGWSRSSRLFVAGDHLIAVRGDRIYAVSRSTWTVRGELSLPAPYPAPTLYLQGRNVFVVSGDTYIDGALSRDHYVRVTHATLLETGELRGSSHVSIHGFLQRARLSDGSLQLHIITRLSSPHADHPGDDAGARYPVDDPSDIYFRGPPRAEPWLNALVEVWVTDHGLTARGRGIVVPRGAMRGGEITERALYVRAQPRPGRGLIYRIPFARGRALGGVLTPGGVRAGASLSEPGTHLLFEGKRSAAGATGEARLLVDRIPISAFTAVPREVQLERPRISAWGVRAAPIRRRALPESQAPVRLSRSWGNRGRRVTIDGPVPLPHALALPDETPSELALDHPIIVLYSPSHGPKGYVAFSRGDDVRVFDVDTNPDRNGGPGRPRPDQSRWRAREASTDPRFTYPLSLPPPWTSIYSMPVVVLTDTTAASAYVFIEVTSGSARVVGYILSTAHRFHAVACGVRAIPSEVLIIGDRMFLMLSGELIEARLTSDHHVVEVRRLSLFDDVLPIDTEYPVN